MSEFFKWMIKGDEYYDKEEFDKSIEAYNHALEFDMNKAEIWNNLGYAYTGKALKMDINSDEEYKEETNMLEMAIQKHQNALHHDPENIEAWYSIGQNYYFIENYEQSIKAYKEILKLNPEDTEIWLKLADAYAMEGEHDDQQYALEKALEINSSDPDIWQNLGKFYYYVKKNYKKALGALVESIKIDSNNGFTWVLLGHVHRDKSEYRTAIKLYKKAIEVEPNVPLYRTYLGLVYHRIKDYENAINTYKSALAINPRSGSTWNYLGVSYSSVLDYDNALKAFEESLTIYYKNITVWNNLIRIHLKLENYKKVIELCENISKIKGLSRDIVYKREIPKTYELLSIAYKHAGRFKESLEASDYAKQLNRRSKLKIKSTGEELKSTDWKSVLSYRNAYSEEKLYEKQIEDAIVKNPEILEEGLKLIGRQFKTSVGFIDILFKDHNDNYLIVELKKGKGSDKVVGQIQRYMAWVIENLTQAKPVRGIIVVKKLDKKLNYAIKGSKFPIEVRTFKNEPPVIGNIKFCDSCGAVNRKSAKFCEKCQNEFWMK